MWTRVFNTALLHNCTQAAHTMTSLGEYSVSIRGARSEKQSGAEDNAEGKMRKGMKKVVRDGEENDEGQMKNGRGI